MYSFYQVICTNHKFSERKGQWDQRGPKGFAREIAFGTSLKDRHVLNRQTKGKNVFQTSGCKLIAHMLQWADITKSSKRFVWKVSICKEGKHECTWREKGLYIL